MTRLINFRGADASKNEISAANGEVAAAYGLTQRRDGSWVNLPERGHEVQPPDARLPIEAAAPMIQFGLQRVGMLVTADHVVTKAGALPVANGSGASQTRPVLSAHYDESVNVSKAIIDSYLRAVRHQAISNGYLTQPFMLRYGLRMSGGRYLWVSQPIMMLPTVLPPRIVVSTTVDSDGAATIAIDLTQNKYFQLRYRIVEGLDPGIRDLVEAVDIFASQPVDTYDVTDTGSGYITSYSQVVEAAGSLGTLRGRRESRGADGTFDGHYSEAGDCYVDHLLPELSQHAWFVTPNHRMTDQLLTTDRYYRVASLPGCRLEAMNDFATVPLSTADFKSLDRHVQISSSGSSGLSSPTAVFALGDTLIVASDSRIMPEPRAIAASAAFYGSASAAIQPVDIEVYLRHNGQICMASATGPGMGVPLADYVPRYISYPDAEAFMMVLRQGETIRVLPLTADESGTSAYWCYMIADEATEADIPDHASGPEIHSVGDLYIGDSYGLRPANVSLGATVHALCGAMHAARSGQFGQYPVYAFTANGVFMLRIDDSTHTITAARQISAETCTNRSVAPDGEGRVYYIADEHIRVVDGSDCKTLSEALSAWPTDLMSMPLAAEIVEGHGIRLSAWMPEGMVADATLSFDRKQRILWVSVAETTLAYAADTGVWSLAGTHGMLVTRAIKAEAVSSLALHTADVTGRLSPLHAKTALYGSNDLIHWHMTSAVEGPSVSLCDATPYRYWRLLVLTELGDDEWLHGLLLS